MPVDYKGGEHSKPGKDIFPVRPEPSAENDRPAEGFRTTRSNEAIVMEEKLTAAIESRFQHMEEGLSLVVDTGVRNIIAETAYMRQVAQYQRLGAEVTKSLSIEIADKDLENLQGSSYKLCIAKKVREDDFNVVWKSFDEYSTYTEISWVPMYTIFATKKFEDDAQVTMMTKIVPIGLGETCLLDMNCLMHAATTGGPKTALTLDNQYQKSPVHVGVSQMLHDDVKGQQSLPIYVAPKPSIMGKITLTPVERVQIWFSQSLQTSTMFSEAVSNVVEVDLTSTNHQSLLFENSVWKIV